MKRRPGRPWPVMVVGGLLLGQAALLLSAGLYALRPVWAGEPLLAQLPLTLNGLALGLIGLVTLVNGLGLWAGWRRAWLGAMFFQGATLLLGLNLYLREKPAYVYPLLLASVIVVLYLNHADVLAAFRVQAQDSRHER